MNVNQTIMLYTLNSHSDVCHLSLNNMGKNICGCQRNEWYESKVNDAYRARCVEWRERWSKQNGKKRIAKTGLRKIGEILLPFKGGNWRELPFVWGRLEGLICNVVSVRGEAIKQAGDRWLRTFNSRLTHLWRILSSGAAWSEILPRKVTLATV